MKNVSLKKSLALLISFQLAVAPVFAQTPPPGSRDRSLSQNPSSGLTEPVVFEITRDLEVDGDGSVDKGRYVIRIAQAQNESQREKLEAWYQAEKSQTPDLENSHEYHLSYGGQPLTFSKPEYSAYDQARGLQRHVIDLDPVDKLRDWLGLSKDWVKDNRGLITMAVIRGSSVAGVTTASFLKSSLPFAASLHTGIALGAMSFLFQLNSRLYTKMIVHKGWVAHAYANIAAGLATITGKDFKTVKTKVLETAVLGLANEMTKFFLVEFVFVSVLNAVFLFHDVHLHESFALAIRAIAIAAALTTAGQGSWDVGIAKNNKWELAQAAGREDLVRRDSDQHSAEEVLQGIDKDDPRVKKVESRTALKLFIISIASTGSVALSQAPIEIARHAGHIGMGALALTGISYLLRVVYKTNANVQNAAQIVKQGAKRFCENLLGSVANH